MRAISDNIIIIFIYLTRRIQSSVRSVKPTVTFDNITDNSDTLPRAGYQCFSDLGMVLTKVSLISVKRFSVLEDDSVIFTTAYMLGLKYLNFSSFYRQFCSVAFEVARKIRSS